MSEPLTVACVWVKANVPYHHEYVQRLKRMVKKNLAREHRFVCLTDQAHRLPGVETIPITWAPKISGWWAKLELFAANRFAGRVLYIDLDSLIVNKLDPIVDFPSSFALVPDGGSPFQPITRHQVIKRFNSSVMVWEAGVNSSLHSDWTPAETKTLWGDQDYIGREWPHAGMLPNEWFPRLSAIGNGPVPKEAIVVLAKKPKPDVAARRYPWVDAIWRAA